MNTTDNADFIVAEAVKLGFGDGGIITLSLFSEKIMAYSKQKPTVDSQALLERLEKVHSESRQGSFLVCALPYAIGTEDDTGFPKPFGNNPPFMHIAPFAARHYYKAAVEKLKTLQKDLQKSLNLSKSDFRIFCNSKIPEKWLAKAAGVGEFGKNNLIINSKFGTRFVIAVLFINMDLPPSPSMGFASDPCKNCTKCIDACPVGALSGDGGLDTNKCLQARATTPETWDEKTKKIWGQRLYGCEICQQVCPYNKGIRQKSDVNTGYLGEKISIKGFLSETEEEIREKLKGSALGMSWIPVKALLRNALVAAGNAGMGTEELSQIIHRYQSHSDAVVKNVVY
ncbi:MAG: epoxyqueuosine reductase [Spirochaetales bacterium]|nr:epoxyqueuosine reductase [Spirochaetales bacterium]